MDSKDPKMSPEKYAEMIREAKKRRDESQGRTIPDRVRKAMEEYAKKDRKVLLHSFQGHGDEEKQIPEPVGKWLESRGIDADTLLRLEPLLRKYEGLTDEEKARFEELKDFEPNPGEATLNKVGETKTYQIGNEGLPIYQEDLDMLRKSIPVAKKLLEIQKRKERLDDTSLLTGPDTTENINEISEEDRMKLPDRVKESMLKSQGIKKNDGQQGDWQPGVKFPAGAVEKGLVDPGLEYYEATGRQPETPVEKYYVRQHMKRLKPEEREHYKKLFADMENYNDMTYTHTTKSDEKIRAAMSGWSKEKNTDFPGAKHGEEWLRKQREEQIKDSGDVMFGVDFETQGLKNENPLTLRKYEDLVDLQLNDTRGRGIIDDKPYPTTEEMKNIDEQCNKNVSQDEDKIPQGYYKYSNILKRMDDTHTRKNNDYGDAAYQGYKKYGDFYFLVQLHNKMSRLESLTVGKKTQMVKDESIDDTLLDMANYAIMFLESRHRND